MIQTAVTMSNSDGRKRKLSPSPPREDIKKKEPNNQDDVDSLASKVLSYLQCREYIVLGLVHVVYGTPKYLV